MGKPGAGTGALVGAILTAPLVAVFFLGWRILGLPFVPFDIFDWMTRKLPGGLLTAGIDSMVKVIRVLGVSDTSSAAKAAEQLMATAVVIAGGMIAGALLFLVMGASKRGSYRLAALSVAAVAGLAAVLVTHSLGRRGSAPVVAGDVWIVASFLIWGVALAWAHSRLNVGGAPATAGAPSVERVNRRQFIVRLGGAAATITVAGAAVGALVGAKRRLEVASGRPWSADHPLPNAGAEVEPPPGTRPELTPLEDHYRIDINTAVPVVDEASWSLKFGGLIERPVEMTLGRIREYEPMHQFVTLACISNPVGGSLIGTTRWTGVSFKRLLPELGVKPNATHFKISAADGFYEVVALETIQADERVMLAYAWDGLPLETKHGFPLRIYIPDFYGMKQPKWIQSIEAMDHWEAGYWVERGWDQTARMKATSVIDAIAVDMMLSQANEKTRIPVGGIAHAGARGISKVEVRVDEGAWNEARLRSPLSATTWVVWRYDWPFQPGDHTFTVRCVDGRGAAQIVEPAPPHPSGASGLHTKKMML